MWKQVQDSDNYSGLSRNEISYVNSCKHFLFRFMCSSCRMQL